MTNLIPISENSFAKYLCKVNNIPSLTQEEEYMLAKKYLESHDIESAQILVRSHLKLVVKVALAYKRYGLPIQELVSEGNIGLMYAVKKFDPELGYRLSTYAMWWIKAAIQEYILKSWSIVKIGTTSAQKKLFFSLGKIKKKIHQLEFRSINSEDYKKIAQDLGVTEYDVLEMDKRMQGQDISLNTLINEEGSELMEFIPESRPNQEVIIANKEEKQQQHQMLLDALKLLNEREYDIFLARRLKDEPLTLDELSKKYDISKERVRQIENKAFSKIQSYILSLYGSN